MQMKRHDLAHLSPISGAGFERQVIDGLLPPFRSPDIAAEVRQCIQIYALPGIVCRPTQPISGLQIQLGFSFPFSANGSRVRSAVVVQKSEVTAITTPYEVAQKRETLSAPISDVLSQVLVCGERASVQVGVIGSVALQMVTGQTYVSSTSDLDLVVECAPHDALQTFYFETQRLAGELGVRLDVEVIFPDGNGVKLSELMSKTRTVLAKSLTDVCMLDRDTVLRAMTESAA